MEAEMENAQNMEEQRLKRYQKKEGKGRTAQERGGREEEDRGQTEANPEVQQGVRGLPRDRTG